eukprot:14217314-Heterocapsa_arctica.AAC.1
MSPSTMRRQRGSTHFILYGRMPCAQSEADQRIDRSLEEGGPSYTYEEQHAELQPVVKQPSDEEPEPLSD